MGSWQSETGGVSFAEFENSCCLCLYLIRFCSLCSFSSACSALGVAQLDSVIIAPPPVEDGNSLSLEYLQPYWQELENLVQNKKIVAIGTSDLDKTLLEQLYLWAQVRTNFLLVAFLGQSNCFVGCHIVIIFCYRWVYIQNIN